MQNPADILGPDGPLAKHIHQFAPRTPQQEMAAAVERAMEDNGVLVVEAGTGTGKTYAYLVPALLSGGKVIISTGTRTLQDQLYHRDLPLVRDALGVPVRIALLKGRANYLCSHRLLTAVHEGRLRSRKLANMLRQIREWSGRTLSGDIAEVTVVAEDAQIWPLVTSTAENCLGQECPSWSDCFVMKSRRAAQEADIVIINHHLLFADMALKEEGFGDLLPGANAFVLDEAHQLPEVASNFFGISLSSRQLNELARDTLAEHLQEAGDMEDLPKAKDQLEKAILDLRLSMGKNTRRVPWRIFDNDKEVQKALAELQEALTHLGDWLEQAAPRGKGLENCWRRCTEFIERLELLMNSVADEYIHWVDVHMRTFTLNLTPLDIAPGFQGRMQARPCAWIFTSATLAVGDSFNHYMSQLGITDAETIQLESTFDYQRNALLYIPQDMPEPNTADYTRAVVRAALPVIEASEGRVFLLFTSHRALKEAAELLDGEVDFPMLVQGDAPRGELLERFRDLGNAILLGTSSFWEGVDVRGSALSCVIIDKLPFASPGDPILQARIDLLKSKGGNPFMDYQLPNAVITLKQGVGRLIRDVDDSGVMMLCDPRLLSKPYGRIFLNSLPSMRRTRDVKEVAEFFTSL